MLLLFCLLAVAWSVRPVVLLHGMMATNNSMDDAASWIAHTFPGAYVANLDTGSRLGAIVADMNVLCAQVAELVRADPKLQGGFNAVGHSQGGLLLRCYVERYMHLPGYPRMHNLVSWLGVQNGVFGVPDVNALCPDRWPWCLALDSLLDTFLNDPTTSYRVQDHLTFASFWKDVLHYEAYTELNNFLADINNERETKDSQYRTNLLQLDNFLCIYGLLDEVVIPQTSPIFSFFPPGNTSVVLPFEQTPQYSGDWLGLRTLQQSKRLHFASVNCTHTGAPSNQCKPMIWPLTIPFLNN